MPGIRDYPELLKNAAGHFRTITRHRWLVCVGCFHIGLYWQGLTHDLSKYAPTEFSAGIKYYTGERSPNDLQRREAGYSAAWLHHKGRNRHHFEYWNDYTLDGSRKHPVRPVPMPKRYVAEMFCDRVAASKVYHKDAYTDRSPLEYYERGRSKVLMHPDTDRLLHKMLMVLAEKGEKTAYRYIRVKVLGKKR